MRHWLLSLPCLLVLLPALVQAQSANEDAFARVETSVVIDDDLRITSLGGFGISDRKVGHFDLVYIEADDGEGDTLGIELGGGLAAKFGATFYLGAGLMAGYDSEDDFVGTFFPQAGAVLRLGASFGLMASAKYYASLKGDPEEVVMIGLLYMIA